MEDIFQVLVFIVIIASVLISKSKEVSANHPKKHVQKPVRRTAKQSAPSDADEYLEDETNEFEEEYASELIEEYTPELMEEYTPELMEEFDVELIKEYAPESMQQPVNQSMVHSVSESMQKDAHQPLQEYQYHNPQKTLFNENLNQKKDSLFNTVSNTVSANSCKEVPTHTVAPKKTTKIRIKSPREARVAFIHSEIFNRKYQ